MQQEISRQQAMFVLAEMVDTVRIEPWLFNVKPMDAITEELNKKLANKVVPNVGLCIALHDVIKLDDSHIFPGDGASHTKVHFRFVVFRPFMDEILVGRIRSCSRDGVHVSLGFFDDIVIPPEALQQPCKFDDTEQLWVWQYESEEGTHDMFVDVNEQIRFRVVQEAFNDTTPVGPDDGLEGGVVEESETKKSPYSLVGSISEPGLGLLAWWSNM